MNAANNSFLCHPVFLIKKVKAFKCTCIYGDHKSESPIYLPLIGRKIVKTKKGHELQAPIHFIHLTKIGEL